MHIKTGTSRIALVMPGLGIVIKLPRIKLFRVLGSIVYLVRRKEWFRLWLNTKNPPTYSNFSYQCDIFGGLVANISEFWFYLITRNPFLQPTYLSLFGLVNIQRYGEPCTMDEGPFRKEMERIVGQDCYLDSHHFTNAKNFCMVARWVKTNDKKRLVVRLRMTDYGSPRTQAVIVLRGHRLHERFAAITTCNESTEQKEPTR